MLKKYLHLGNGDGFTLASDRQKINLMIQCISVSSYKTLRFSLILYVSYLGIAYSRG